MIPRYPAEEERLVALRKAIDEGEIGWSGHGDTLAWLLRLHDSVVEQLEQAEQRIEELKGVSVVPLHDGRQLEAHAWGWDVEISLPDSGTNFEVYVARATRNDNQEDTDG